MWIFDCLLDALLDCLKELPFLFAAFYLLEVLEHRAARKMNETLAKAGGLGPLAGALLGCVPQCGFSIMASDFYAGGVISLGTLLAVFLSTSDEALVILLGHPEQFPTVIRLLVTKIVIALIAGYLVYAAELIWLRSKGRKRKRIRDLCETDHCGCEHPLVDPEMADRKTAERKDADLKSTNRNGVDAGAAHAGKAEQKQRRRRTPYSWKAMLKPAWHHTREVILFLFLFTLVLNILLEAVGMENVSRVFLADSIFQPVLASLIGLIPNCAASVILTELYMEGVISFGSAIAGLCSSAGLGLIVLWRVNRDRKESLRITLLLLGLAIVAGIICQGIFP